MGVRVGRPRDLKAHFGGSFELRGGYARRIDDERATATHVDEVARMTESLVDEGSDALVDVHRRRSSHVVGGGSVVEGERATFAEFVHRGRSLDFGAVDEVGALETVCLDTHGASEQTTAGLDVFTMEFRDVRRPGHVDLVDVVRCCKVYAVLRQPHERLLALTERFNAHEVT